MLSKPVWWRCLFGASSLSFLFSALLSLPLSAQETPPPPEASTTQETPTAGTIQGTVKDADGNPVEGSRVLFRSKVEGTSSVARSGKDGAYVSEPLQPSDYLVRVEARNMLIADTHITVNRAPLAWRTSSLVSWWTPCRSMDAAPWMCPGPTPAFR